MTFRVPQLGGDIHPSVYIRTRESGVKLMVLIAHWRSKTSDTLPFLKIGATFQQMSCPGMEAPKKGQTRHHQSDCTSDIETIFRQSWKYIVLQICKRNCGSDVSFGVGKYKHSVSCSYKARIGS